MNIRGLVATRAPAIQTMDTPRDAFDEDAFMTEYDIRVAEPHDLLSVARLIERRPDFTTRHPTETHRETWARVMRTDGLTVYLARRADDAIGTTALHGDAAHHVLLPAHSIPGVDVRPGKYRRHGIARMRVERLLEDAKRAGWYKVQLLTHKRHADDGAHSFYRSMGFEAEAEGSRLYLS